jgi:hypothetical protein
VAGQLRGQRGGAGRQVPGEQRVILGKPRPRRLGRGPDRRPEPLGERDGLRPGARPVDALAHDQARARSQPEPPGQPPDVRRVGALAPGHLAPRQRSRGRVPVVHRHRDERGAGRLVDRLGPGPVQGGRDVAGRGRLGGPLDVGPDELRRAREQVGLYREMTAVLLARHDHQRGAVVVGVHDRAHSVAGTGRAVQGDERRAASGLREAVGHAHDGRLAQPEYIAEVRRELAQERQLRRARVAEQRRHPELAEQVVDDSPDAGHPAAATRRRARRRPRGRSRGSAPRRSGARSPRRGCGTRSSTRSPRPGTR